VRRELLAEIAGAVADDVEPALDDAAAILADPDASAGLRERAKLELRRAIRGERAAAAEAALAVVAGVERRARADRGAAVRDRAGVRRVRHRHRRRADPGAGGAGRAVGARTRWCARRCVPLYARAAPARPRPRSSGWPASG
jgi:hypothetical protein